MDSVDLDLDEWTVDINNVTNVLKMWFRELPEPLLTFNLRQDAIHATSEPSKFTASSCIVLIVPYPEIDNDRLRHIRLHERVNDLPDPNYATLKYFMGHLHRWVALFPSLGRRIDCSP